MKNNDLVRATSFRVKHWIDANGNRTEPIQLKDYEGKFKVVFAYQSWCPGCHSKGFPDLKKMVDALVDNNKIAFFAIQTVFEGHHSNTLEKIREMQLKYDLKIPFGHDAGDDNKSTSNVMKDFKTGGTPWFIFIDRHNNVVFSEFHLNVDSAIEFFKTL